MTDFLDTVSTMDSSVADILDRIDDAVAAHNSAYPVVLATKPPYHTDPDGHTATGTMLGALDRRLTLLLSIRDLIHASTGDMVGSMHDTDAGHLLNRIADVSGDATLRTIADHYPRRYRTIDHASGKLYDPSPGSVADGLRSAADALTAV